MWDFAQRSAWRSRAVRSVQAALFFVLLSALAPAEAHAFRRGLAGSRGGATMGQGQLFWFQGGFPFTGGGWGIALHPQVDLLLHGEVAFGSALRVDQEMLGGGGGAVIRVALVRGSTSLALTGRVGAEVYGRGGRVRAHVDIISPGLDLSVRVSERWAVHGALRLPLVFQSYPVAFVGGFEARGGASVRITSQLGLFVEAAAGSTLDGAQSSGGARVEGLLGLEYLWR